MCCGYGPMATSVGGYDCIIIPQGSRQSDGADLIGSEFCGRGLFTAGTATTFPMVTMGSMPTYSTICCEYYFWKFLIPLDSVLRNDTLLIGNLSRRESKLFLKVHSYLSSNKTTQFISIFSKICPISCEVPLRQLGNVTRSYKKSRWFQNWFQTRGLYLDFEKLRWKKILN